MAYNEKLAVRIRVALADRNNVSERKMFGGLCFMLGSNMCCGIVGDELMARVGPNGYAAALQNMHVRPMDFTGKPMKGMVYVAPNGMKTSTALKKWIDLCVSFAESLPTKKSSKKPTPKRRIRP